MEIIVIWSKYAYRLLRVIVRGRVRCLSGLVFNKFLQGSAYLKTIPVCWMVFPPACENGI